MLLNHFKPEILFKTKEGPFPILLTLGVILGFILDYPEYFNYEYGEQKDIVTLFLGSLKGIGGEELLRLGLLTSLLLFGCSFAQTSMQRAFSLFALFSYLFTLSLHYENQTGFDHSLILPSQFFILICMYHFFHKPSYKSLFLTDYPRWLPTVAAVFLGIHYFGSGVTKIIDSGLSWGDGVSLMTWVSLWSHPQSPLAKLILNNYWISYWAQNLILTIELFSCLFFFKLPKANLILAAFLIAFHIFNELLFEYGFWINIFYLWLLFIKPLLNKKKVVPEA